MRISDWSSDVCSSDLLGNIAPRHPRLVTVSVDNALEHNDPRLRITEQRSAELPTGVIGNAREVLLVKRHLLEEVAISPHRHQARRFRPRRSRRSPARATPDRPAPRSEEHTSELQSLMRISYAVFCLK